MQIIKNRTIINDPWRLEARLAAGAQGDYERVILPLDAWLKLRPTLDLAGKDKPANIGVRLSPEDEVESIAADLNNIALVALDFGSFHEGRGYSQATQLRRQYHFAGEIRALGAHRDNLPLMERCGINAYQLAEGEDVVAALSAFAEITAYY